MLSGRGKNSKQFNLLLLNVTNIKYLSLFLIPVTKAQFERSFPLCRNFNGSGIHSMTMQTIAMHLKACTRTGAKDECNDRDTNMRSYCTRAIKLCSPYTPQILRLACLTICRPFKKTLFLYFTKYRTKYYKILLQDTIIHAHCLFLSLPLIHTELLERLRWFKFKSYYQNYLNYCLLEKNPCSRERQRERGKKKEFGCAN
jgi:hypothetical protein